VLSDHARDEIKALPARFPEVRSAVMPALDIAQEELGWLPKEAVEEVAGLLGVDPGYTEGVSTFYTLFHLQPTGAHHFYVCTNLSCALRGANEIVRHMRERTGIEEHGDVSEDGLFSLDEVECLGACERAPMMRYRHRFHYDLTTELVDGLIDAARSGVTAAGPVTAEADAQGEREKALDPAAAEGRPQPAKPRAAEPRPRARRPRKGADDGD
jgi:NADH-quinone oxidoreductase subunit E